MGDNHASVSVLGLGLMGQALAAAFLKAGHATTVWNRSADKADGLVADGAVLAANPADAVAASDLVIVCVSTYDVVHDVIGSLGDALRGKTLVNLTTGSSEQARQTAEWAEKNGARYLDGAIMITPPGIGAETSVLFYAGDRTVFDAHEPVLGLLGGGTTYLGTDHGKPALFDVSLLGLMWGALNSFLHGVAIVETGGVKAQEFLPWAHMWLDAIKMFTADYAAQIDAGDERFPANDATLETHLGALKHLVEESEALGVDTELPKYSEALMEGIIAQGHAGNSYASVVKAYRRPER
ncbi:NAD(P)-binding domain-containing protein [Streptomyces sp. NEAU-H22]|uniref:NAD(P)-dependent oxidoreductase n=1 Tax=unclassified Streptomyces TaxID=2593676 RepID=UPI00224CE6ED|nr:MULTISPECIES: NAD(P)-binding domain-containing protein [unclassified Streptomyces]MCX3291662.1 NAD(P)-binding domain-containing protein [Streptomyces sp. NEAU-H22]WMD04704.1 NAD(P)-binding domain-containing protein [Streptomyces sp. FXY-T5]